MSLDSLSHKNFKARRRQIRSRTSLHGTIARPRLSVHLSNKNISAQVINDDEGRTIAHATTLGRKEKESIALSAEWLGAEIAKKAKEQKVKKVVFDRGSHKYHGLIVRVADAARKSGLEF